MAKRGRRAAHYKTNDGEVVLGLARRPSDGRWRIIGTGITFTEPNENLAIHRFRQWQRLQSKEVVTFKRPIPHDDIDNNALFQERADGFDEFVIDLDGNVVPQAEVPADVVWATLRDFILSKPLLAAQKLGIPEVAYLKDLPRPGPSPALKTVGQLYFDKARIKPHEQRKSKLFWNEFQRTVRVKTLRELSAEQIAAYYDSVIGSDQSPTYVKHRFGKIKTILRFARTRGVAPDEIHTVLSRCAILQPPKGKAADPHPISRTGFHKLLAVADDKWAAALLCALNFCMYGSEVALIEKHEVNLDEHTLVTDRNKTTVTRVAVLWSRTMDAIQKLPPNGNSYLFVSQTGKPYHPDHVRRNFNRLRKRAGVADSVKFEDLRDGAYTAAVQGKGVQFEHARILAGHRTGMSDHYIKRNPKMVAGCCAAIARHYGIDAESTGRATANPSPRNRGQSNNGAMRADGGLQ